MLAANMSRAHCSRLTVAAEREASRPLGLILLPRSRFVACQSTSAAWGSQVRNIRSSRYYSSFTIGEADDRFGENKTTLRQGATNRFSRLRDDIEWARKEAGSAKGAMKKKFHSQKKHINRHGERVIQSDDQEPSPTAFRHQRHSSSTAEVSSPKPKNYKSQSGKYTNATKVDKANYLQWGYLRHQYSKSEVLPARRAFNSWKTKLANVLNPKNPTTWQWREQGRWLFEKESIATMRQAWDCLDENSRRQQWPLTMLSTLHLSPDKSAAVLEATMNPLPPGYAIHDVLLFLAKRLRLSDLKSVRERTVKAEETLEILTKVIEDTPTGHVPFGQRTFGIFAKKLPSDQVNELYAILTRSNIDLHPNTLLQFASSLSRDAPHKAVAFDILKGLAERGADLNEARPASVITSLLHCKAGYDGWSQQKQDFSPKYALQYFMEKGLAPNVVNSTAFLDSLCQHSDVEEAIRLALLFAESGVQLDAKAFATVFRGAKHSLKVENVVRALDVAKVSTVPYEDVLSNALHAIFYFTEMESREKKQGQPPWILPIFGPMLRIYATRFDLELLQKWVPDSLPLLLAQENGLGGEKFESQQPGRWDVEESIIPVVEKFFSSGEGPRLRPTSTVIAIMLRSYIKSLQHSYDIMSFYSFFKSRLEERDPQNSHTLQLIRDQGSLIHDAFIMAMTERRGLSRPALQVFGDMLKDYLKSVRVEKTEKANDGLERGQHGEAAPVHPAPSLCTFSILVHGLLNQGERLLAEQVIQVMREHGIEPNLVTWNTLTKGYALMQNTSETVATLRNIEATGLKPDLYTFKAFDKLKDQNKALEMMEGIIDVNRKKMFEDEMYD